MANYNYSPFQRMTFINKIKWFLSIWRGWGWVLI